VSDGNLIGHAIEAALDEMERRVLARVEQLIDEKLARHSPPEQLPRWMTPPAAARARGISLKRVRALVAAGAVQSRPKMPGSDKKEIFLPSLDAALAATQELPKPVSPAAWARARLARRGGAG
jgi:hypothetical protein